MSLLILSIQMLPPSRMIFIKQFILWASKTGSVPGFKVIYAVLMHTYLRRSKCDPGLILVYIMSS